MHLTWDVKFLLSLSRKCVGDAVMFGDDSIGKGIDVGNTIFGNSPHVRVFFAFIIGLYYLLLYMNLFCAIGSKLLWFKIIENENIKI